MRRARTRSTVATPARPGRPGRPGPLVRLGRPERPQPPGTRGRAESGYEIVSDKTINATSSRGAHGFFSVSCPQGKKAVGGGGSAVHGIGAIGVNDGVSFAPD